MNLVANLAGRERPAGRPGEPAAGREEGRSCGGSSQGTLYWPSGRTLCCRVSACTRSACWPARRCRSWRRWRRSGVRPWRLPAGSAGRIMEKLEHSLWIVGFVNALLGPLVAAALAPLGIEFEPGHDVIPNFIVMLLLILVGISALCLFIRSRLSVENPGTAAACARRGRVVPERDARRLRRPEGAPLSGPGRDDVHLHPDRQPDGDDPRADGADEQHQRDVRLRADRVGLLPASRASRSRVSSAVHQALRGAARRPALHCADHASRSRSSATCRGCCRSRCGCSATSSARSWSS